MHLNLEQVSACVIVDVCLKLFLESSYNKQVFYRNSDRPLQIPRILLHIAHNITTDTSSRPITPPYKSMHAI